MADSPDGAGDQVVLFDAEEMTRSLTGFEEIAIEACFGRRLKGIVEDETALMRALVFVDAKRAGAADVDAFRTVMLARLDDVVARFAQPQAEPVDPSVQAEHDGEYAGFVVGVGVSFMPDQYRALTIGQRGALIAAANRRAG